MKPSILLLLTVTLSACYQGKEADLIVHNATIYSCDEEFNVYEAMAIKDGEIIQLGPEREILNGYKCDNLIDAMKKPVYPGFHDAHCHFIGYAKTLGKVDLIGCRSYDEMIERIIDFENTNHQFWTLGRGWDQTMWPENDFPTNERLNELFPEKPAFFTRVDGHAAIVNDFALKMAGINPATRIEGGEIILKNGKCTGVLIDNAMSLISQLIPVMEEEALLPLMKQAEYNLFEAGLTSINDAGINPIQRDRFIKWYKQGDLSIKNYSMLAPDEDNLAFAKDNGIFSEGNYSIRSFKLYADGALGSRGACLLNHYSDDSTNQGFLVSDTTWIREVAELAAVLDYQVNTHAIGDSANRTILKIYEQVIGAKADHRWKIEHAQVINENDFDLFEMYHIIPSVQPTHCTSDMRWAEERLGPHRVKFAYAYQKLLDKSGMLALGTDFPVERIYPLETFYAAVARMDREGYPEGGFQNEDAISREDALRGMTIWPAYSNFENHKKGSLEAGKSADFVILTKDIMKIPYEEILETFVDKTYLNGREVYSSY
jgi:predicted amidohydrolase YtcJ